MALIILKNIKVSIKDRKGRKRYFRNYSTGNVETNWSVSDLLVLRSICRVKFLHNLNSLVLFR